MEDRSAELVRAFQKGDKDAFEKLFELYKVRAVRTAYLMTSNSALAEDITQEAFVQCYEKINSLKDPMQFKSWFFKILTRIAWRMSSKEKRITPIENIFEVADYEEIAQVEADFIKSEDSKKLMVAVNNLEEKQKTTVLLYYYNEFSIGEIAKVMGCFEGRV